MENVKEIKENSDGTYTVVYTDGNSKVFSCYESMMHQLTINSILASASDLDRLAA